MPFTIFLSLRVSWRMTLLSHIIFLTHARERVKNAILLLNGLCKWLHHSLIMPSKGKTADTPEFVLSIINNVSENPRSSILHITSP